MTKDQCIELGYVKKAHGIQGHLLAVFDVYDLSEYLRRKKFWFAKGDNPLEERSILSIRPSKKMELILRVEGVNDRNTAEEWVGTSIFLPETELPALPDGHYYYFQVIGFQVVDERLGPLGLVKDFADGTAQDILMMEYEGKEVLIPLTEAFVGKADFESRTISTSLPDGLLEAYLE